MRIFYDEALRMSNEQERDLSSVRARSFLPKAGLRLSGDLTCGDERRIA